MGGGGGSECLGPILLTNYCSCVNEFPIFLLVILFLFLTTQNHSKVLELVSRQLSHVASTPASPHSDRERLQILAISIAERYRTYGHTASRQLSQTFHLLLDIMQFFDHYHASRSDTALEVCVVWCVRAGCGVCVRACACVSKKERMKAEVSGWVRGRERVSEYV